MAQLCPTLWDLMDCNLTGFSVHGILQARILQWVAIPFSRGSSQHRNQTQVSFIAGRFFTVWTTREAQLGLYSPRNSPGQNTGVGNCSLRQGIFPTQGSNPGLLHCRRILYQLSHQGSARILEWVAYPFCSRFSQPRNRTIISCLVQRYISKLN